MKRTIVVFSGAGLSAESGIPTFRATDGLWENHRVEDVAHPNGWRNNRQLVLEFYAQRFHNVRKAEPNAAHHAFANLEKAYDVIHITQNIDDLLERAGCANVRHLHGSLFKRKCERHGTVSHGKGRNNCSFEVVQDVPVTDGDLCPKCGGHLRPSVVWFEEPVDLSYDSIAPLVKKVKYEDGVFICVGTSANVYPAASLLPFFAQVQRKYIMNLECRAISDYRLIEGPASQTVPLLAEQLLADADRPLPQSPSRPAESDSPYGFLDS